MPAAAKSITLSVVIPIYNEARTLETMVTRLMAVEMPVAVELVLVDDGSTDGTLAIAERLRHAVGSARFTIVRQTANQGKGACIRRGVRAATGDWVMIHDADLEYDPRDIPSLLQPMRAGGVDAVYGSRFLRRSWPDGMAAPNFIANRVLTWLTNRLYHLHLTDMETCYKVMPRDQLAQLALRAQRFEFEPEVTAHLATRGLRIVEVPVSFHGRTRHEGKKIRGRDFLVAVWTLIRCHQSAA